VASPDELVSEVPVTLRRNEKGYGFELTDGRIVSRIAPSNSPSLNASTFAYFCVFICQFR
jgi:hypothetical protein